MPGLVIQLAEQLRAAHAVAPDSRKVASIHLFGIANAEALSGVNKYDIAEQAGLSRSYGAELHKAVVLSEYVEIIRPLA